MHRMYVASIRLDFYEEWMERTERNLDARLDLLLTRNLITSVDLIICHVKLMQSTALAQKRFDLWSLSPALRNL